MMFTFLNCTSDRNLVLNHNSFNYLGEQQRFEHLICTQPNKFVSVILVHKINTRGATIGHKAVPVMSH